MIKCIKCQQISTIKRAGMVREKQRYHCKDCNIHFTVPIEETENTAPKKRHQATIVDIAQIVGVSHATVSRALNGQAGIKPATRQAILEVAAQLDYQPNLLAQSLNKSETHIIGVIIPDIERPFFASILSGIQQVASAAGYKVMICQSNENHQTEVNNVLALVSSRVDGLLISHTKETVSFDHIKLQHRKGIPIIHFDRVCEDIDTPKIIQDDFGGAFEVVSHLIKQGCRRIAILVGPDNLLICQKRLNGYKEALTKGDLPLENDLIYHGNLKKNTALAALDFWLTLSEPPDAIFSIYDAGAIDIIFALKQKGFKVPKDIAIAGFGDEPIASLINPSLTTFQQNPYKMGQVAAQTFLDMMIQEEQFEPQAHLINGELVVRASSLKNAESL